MRITCPLCGTRPLEEFTHRGDATVNRPTEEAGEQAWVNYVYLRDNPKGWHREHWRHASGCGSWLVVERNTVTHEIAGVSEARTTGESDA